MKHNANPIIDALGGTSAVARLIKAPISTVHYWRKHGITETRLDHLKLAVQASGMEWPLTSPDNEPDK